MGQKQLIELPWPRQGLVENSALSTQTPGSTTDCLNVRNYDVYDRRNRGGQRSGHKKYFSTKVNGSNAIQRLGQVVQSFDVNTVVADNPILTVDEDNDFTLGQEIQTDSVWTEREVAEGSTPNKTQPDITTPNGVMKTSSHLSDVYITNTTTSNSDPGVLLVHTTTLVVGSSYVVQCLVDPPDEASTASHRGIMGIFLRLDLDDLDNDTGYISVGWRSTSQSGTQDVQMMWGVGVTPARVADMTNLGSTTEVLPGTPVRFEVRVKDNIFTVFMNFVEIGQFTSSSNASEVGIGFYCDAGEVAASDNNSPWIKDILVSTGSQPASLRTSKVVVVSGGNIYSGAPADGLTLVTGGTDALIAVGFDMGLHGAFQKVYFCDGTTANYSVLTLLTNAVADWGAAVTAGTIPQGSADATKACRIMALYRGRIVMSGLQSDPQNWFMSKVGDPLDWDYAPAITTAIQAVAGNNADAGELGDIMTALAPYSDDLMVMGGANSLWVMRGDPAAGGAIDNISYETGIVGPDAITWDWKGNLYFFGTNGLYRLPNGSFTPELVSDGRLDKIFSEVDPSVSRIILSYDLVTRGIHILISPLTQPTTASTHYFYDERTDSFWPDQYPIAHGPTAVLAYKGDGPTDTAVMLGGYDGFIRQFDANTLTDDGTVISSRVRMTPVTPGRTFGSARLDELTFILDQQSDDVTVKVWVGDTVEEAERLADAAGTPAFQRTIIGGRNNPIRNRAAANAFMIELSQSGTATAGAASWAYESGGGSVQILARMRGRHVS